MNRRPWLLPMGLLAASQACIYYDENDKCGQHMLYNKDAHLCLCDGESISVGGACQPCGDGRVPLSNKCVCPSGTQENAAKACEPIKGLGDACASGADCAHPVYSYCAIAAGKSAGTCTNRCTRDDECAVEQTCADWEATPHCMKFASVAATCSTPGLGDPACSADADLCFMGQCFVRACTVTDGHKTDDCPRDRKCCDVSSLKLANAATACVLLSSSLCP
jgi:hypothetical protein